MTPKLLTQNGWKPIAQRSQVRDNGLIRALLTYERLAEDKLDERVEALEEVKKLATDLKKVREVAAKEEAKDYLEDVAKAAEDERKKLASQVARVENQVKEIRAAVARFQAAQSQKPDFAKLKRLLTEIEPLTKRLGGRRAGSGPGKGGEADPCGDKRTMMLATMGLFAVSATAAAAVAIETMAASAAATAVVSAESVAATFGFLLRSGGATTTFGAYIRLLQTLISAMTSLGALWYAYNEAYQEWFSCRSQQEVLDHMDEEDPEITRRVHEAMRQRYEQARREADRAEQLREEAYRLHQFEWFPVNNRRARR